MVRLSKSIWFYSPGLDDSISLKIAKIPQNFKTAIGPLTIQWAAIVQLHGDKSSVTSDVIHISNGIFQGDSISVLLFILSLNILSCMLSKLKGYNYGNDQQKTATRFLSTTSNFTAVPLMLPKTTRPCDTIFKAYLHGFWNWLICLSTNWEWGDS